MLMTKSASPTWILGWGMSAYSLSVVQCAMKKVNPLEIVVIFYTIGLLIL